MNDQSNDPQLNVVYSESSLLLHPQTDKKLSYHVKSTLSQDDGDFNKDESIESTSISTIVDKKSGTITHKKMSIVDDLDVPLVSIQLSAQHKKYDNYRSFHSPNVRAGINIFNENANAGLAYLIAINYLEPNAKSVAEFFKNVHFLSKDNVGEVLGSISNPFCVKILDNFVECFDFTSMYPDEALRSFQNYFRMPGEAQKIHAILNSFSERYIFCNKNSNFLKSNSLLDTDSILILVYAIVMLNTDLHNPSVKKKMSLDQFLDNMNGVESCKNIPKTFLKDIYTNISKNEFTVGFDHMKQLNEMSSLITGKGVPRLVLPQRQFIGIRDVSEIRNFKYRERSCNRSMFVFNDILVFTRAFNQKSIKHRLSLNINKNHFYFYVKSVNLKSIQPVTLSSNEIPHNVGIVSHNGSCVAILDCHDNQNREKVLYDLKQFCYEAYLTDFLVTAIPKNFFKNISECICSSNDVFSLECVKEFKSKLDHFTYPILTIESLNITLK